MQTFKQYLIEANRVTPDEIIERILSIRDGKHTPISKHTCWNRVGLYLLHHPDTKGFILLYGVDDSVPKNKQYVNHAVLVDVSGDVLVDTGGGSISSDQRKYTNKAGDDGLDLIDRFKL